MAAHTRKAGERDLDRKEIARLYRLGVTQRDIAARVNLSPQMVHYDLGVLRKEWRTAAGIDIAEAQGHALEELDRLEFENWQAYERSRQGKETFTEAEDEDGIKRTKKTEACSGDPAYLENIRRIVQDRCRILGCLRQPGDGTDRANPTDPDGIRAFDARAQWLIREIRIREVRLAGGGPGGTGAAPGGMAGDVPDLPGLPAPLPK